MSRLTPEKPKVRCMDCAKFDIRDMWCIPKGKDVQDPCVELRCQRFVKIKEKTK